MKIILLPLFCCSFFLGYSQQDNVNEEKKIKKIVDLFFNALETKDTVLYQKLAHSDAQIWTVRNVNGLLKNSSRTIGVDIERLASMKETIEERPLHYEIKIHNDIAIAWVPYTLSLSGTFSHCGIDVFTFLRTSEGWRIVNVSYSIEPYGCAAIKKDIPG